MHGETEETILLVLKYVGSILIAFLWAVITIFAFG
jgi:hypothetical protein